MPTSEFPTSLGLVLVLLFFFVGLSHDVNILVICFLLCEYRRAVSSRPKCHKSGGLVPVPRVLQSTS